MDHQGKVGTLLAGMVLATWLSLHVYAVFFDHLQGVGLAIAPILVLALCWLDVGLFIIAHDAMHGSLAPHRPAINIAFGRISLALYAAFRFERLKRLHAQHHAAPGSRHDPDFSIAHPTRFWPWYSAFMRRYFGINEFLMLCPPVAAYLLIGARIENILLFWALPAGLSSLQLFYFGTYLPHRQGTPFADRHNARTSEFNTLVSLLTCFHFGYHHEHHLAPGVSWWRLPAERRRRLARSDRLPDESLRLP